MVPCTNNLGNFCCQERKPSKNSGWAFDPPSDIQRVPRRVSPVVWRVLSSSLAWLRGAIYGQPGLGISGRSMGPMVAPWCFPSELSCAKACQKGVATTPAATTAVFLQPLLQQQLQQQQQHQIPKHLNWQKIKQCKQVIQVLGNSQVSVASAI